MTTKLVVEAVHRIPSRPWLFVTGRLEGDELRVGDQMTVAHDGVNVASAVIRSIELHGHPGRSTIAVDVDPPDALRAGAALFRS